MSIKPFKHTTLHALAGLLGALCLQTSSRADLVLPGWDLFQTDPNGTTFLGQNFQGVGLGTYNFGGAIGVQNVGATDTIMQRLNSVGAGGDVAFGAPALLLMDALQLRSVNMFDPDGAGPAPLNYYFITLQSGPASGGTITILANNTFTSEFMVYYDFRVGALNGPIVNSDSLHMYEDNTTPLSSAGWWQHDPAGSPLITGVNYHLDGSTTANDFWAGGFIASDGIGDVHSVPEPSPVALSLVTLLGVGGVVVRRKLKAC